jgi:cystathionine gamma-lyase
MTIPIDERNLASIETPPRAASPVHGFGTLAVHAGSPHDPTTGAVIEAVS